MAEELKREAFLSRLKELCPTVENMRLMLVAARHAFNRHSQAKLEEIARLQEDIIFDLDPIFEKLETNLKKGTEVDKPDLLKLQEIVSQVELMADKIAKLAEPIRRKGNRGAILADKDLFCINDLFSQQTGFLSTLVDIFHINDASLKAYVLNAGEKLRDSCFRNEVEHETRMMDSPGQAGAWSIYIDLLNRFREILGHLINIVKTLG
jgi:Na+/phosphate symporter